MSRLAALRAMLAAEGLDALVVFSPYNRSYLSGFTGSSGWLVISANRAALVTDGRYVEQAAQQARGFEVVRHEPGEPFVAVAAEVGRAGAGRVGFEAHAATFAEVEQLRAALGTIPVVPARPFVEDLRMVKDAAEIAAIRRAVALADRAFAHVEGMIRPGVREADVALELEFFLRRQGAEGMAFETIVASGPRSALPHGVASDRPIQAGEMVTLDFGCRVGGYCSDMTRTVAVGEPPAELRAIYDVVLRAQEAALAAVAPGKSGREVDRVARDVIAAAGYGERFPHGTGHGVGLFIHEGPRLSPKGETVLQPGMVVTVEPGVYLPGVGGVRIEDMALVTETGSLRLTEAPKQLRILTQGG